MALTLDNVSIAQIEPDGCVLGTMVQVSQRLQAMSSHHIWEVLVDGNSVTVVPSANFRCGNGLGKIQLRGLFVQRYLMVTGPANLGLPKKEIVSHALELGICPSD